MGASLSDRMKGYESVPDTTFTRRMPLIIRVDGRAFHTLTRGLDKPFDVAFQRAMLETAAAICDDAQGAKIAYVQSDEISVLLTDYDTLQTEAWFGGRVQKVVSLAASIATAAFNASWTRAGGRATFDARAFTVPREDVCNYFLWRQQDATRNSIQGYGQTRIGKKAVRGMKCDEIQDAMFQADGFNWNDEPTINKRGACVIHSTFMRGDAERHAWEPDLDIPIFSVDRDYIEQLVYDPSRASGAGGGDE